MKQGLDYPLYIITPDVLNITAKEFHNLSVMGLGCLLISWKHIIEKCEDKYKMYGSESIMQELKENDERFKDDELKWWINRGVEMIHIDIPFNHPIAKIIETDYSHLIMK